MLKKLFIFIFILTILLDSQANALLITADWKASGDGLVTIDTGSGLGWLDMNQTIGRSFIDMSNQLYFGGYFYGFRYATTEEVDFLISSAGGIGNYYNYPFVYPKNHIQDIAVTNLLINLMGYTSQSSADSAYIYAMTSDIYLAYSSEVGRYLDTDRRWLHLIQSGYPSIDFGYVSLNASGAYISHDSFNVGSFLVKDITSIPEPSTFLLLGSGLISLLWFGRNRVNP